MKAIILAAGIGSRLRPMTNTKPKSMVNVAGIPMIQYQVDAYKKIGVQEIIIVVGYYGEKIMAHFIHEKVVKITFVDNPDYEDTNNMYSLYLARSTVGESPFYLSNADVVFDPEILLKYTGEHSCIFVEKCEYNVESMKVTVNESGLINGISKKITAADSFALSIDVYKFSKTDSITLFSYISNRIEAGNYLKDWTEVALDHLFVNEKICPIPVDIEKSKWVEIDNYDDLSIADKKFSTFDASLKSYDTFIFDLDGTLFLENIPIRDAIAQVNELLNSNKTVYFMTNNSSKTKSEYVKKLGLMGLSIDESKILSSLDSILYFFKKNNVQDIFLLGTEKVRAYMQDHDIDPDSSSPEYVVIAYDTSLAYHRLSQACIHINNGVDFIATHPDVFCPTPNGGIPDCGAITKMIEMTTQKTVKKVFGKPNADVFEHLDMIPEKTVIVGDRIYTDGLLAKNTGCHYVLVLSGETSRDMIDEDTGIPIALCLKDFGQITS